MFHGEAIDDIIAKMALIILGKNDLLHWLQTWKQICRKTSKGGQCGNCKLRNGDRAMPECLAAFTIIAELIEAQPGNITWIREPRECNQG